ncbi:MAG: RNase adapter RapZ [Peptostreptococcales bacterium]
MKIIIITGLSGAGKTKAVDCMEDLGYYCIDNLPPKLMQNFLSLGSDNIEKAALVMDIRGGDFFSDLIQGIEDLEKDGLNYKVIFLEASDEVLVRRFKESRRIHPVTKDGNLGYGIKLEREKLLKIREIADYIIDTSHIQESELKEELKKIVNEHQDIESLPINLVSFGFKHGILLEADLVFDVRFIPNPFYLASMKKLTGNNKKVRDYVMKWEESTVFIDKVKDLVDFLMPYYIKEGKSQLVIGIGCTGGHHRSVALANELAEILMKEGKHIIVNHRDL